ncbi:MAG TPA: hypothetical protein VG204_12315 [Terriglobia bacterium]|nr:hypothetical protein [Terriglobia bacterium]
MFRESSKAWRSLAVRLFAVICLGIVGSISALGGSTVVGSVAGSLNSMVGDQPVLPNAVIFSGDTVRVKDGATVIAVSGGSQFVVGRESQASFLRDGSTISVLLGRGNLSVYETRSTLGLEVKADGLSIVPEKGFKTLGEVAMLDGAVRVTVKEGILRVEGNGSPIEVAKGRTITIQPKMMRAPQANVSGGNHSQKVLTLAALGVGAAGLVIGAVGISRANTANDAAKAASNTAASAANAAAAAALAAQAATNLASAVEKASLLESNLVGCDLNQFANSQGQPSPYTPPPGFSCQ